MKCRIAALILFSLVLRGQDTIISCGSATDPAFDGFATTYNGQTVRYGNFHYEFKAENIPYIITVNFIEPTVQSSNQRVFSVVANNQTVLDSLDIFREAGYLVPINRSFIVVGADEKIKIYFKTIIRNAICSKIIVAKQFLLFAHGSGLLRVDGSGFSVTGVPTLSEWFLAPGWFSVPALQLR